MSNASELRRMALERNQQQESWAFANASKAFDKCMELCHAAAKEGRMQTTMCIMDLHTQLEIDCLKKMLEEKGLKITIFNTNGMYWEVVMKWDSV